MTIPFTCPHCGTQTDVYDEFAGQTGPCGICGKLITVPVPTAGGVVAGVSPSPRTVPVASRRPRSGSSLLLVAAVVGGGILAAGATLALLFLLVFPAVSAARNSRRKSECAKNLERIALALQQYEARYGSFPPAYLADANGKPKHSWRTLLLPFLGYDHVYRRYDFNKPWDDPSNMALRGLMPPEYACPADPDARGQGETNYMVVVGPGTMFPSPGTVKRGQITDGVESTLLVTETVSCGVCWLEPQDLDFRKMRFVMNGKAGSEIGSKHRGGVEIVTVDGKSHFLTADTASDVILSLLTIAGGESIPWFQWE